MHRALARAPGAGRGAPTCSTSRRVRCPSWPRGCASEVGGRPVVGLGGGRVVDVAKAVTAADGTEAAAIPTTLAGSTVHALPPADRGAPARRCTALRWWSASPRPWCRTTPPLLAATAMNSLAHAMESLYAPARQPGHRGGRAAGRPALLARRCRRPRARARPRRGRLPGRLRGGERRAWRCTTPCARPSSARCGTPHAQTNAVMLPHSARLMSRAARRSRWRLRVPGGAGWREPSPGLAARRATPASRPGGGGGSSCPGSRRRCVAPGRGRDARPAGRGRAPRLCCAPRFSRARERCRST